MPLRFRDQHLRCCEAFMCTCTDTMSYKTVLPNGVYLQVCLCEFHSLELEEVEFDLGKLNGRKPTTV